MPKNQPSPKTIELDTPPDNTQESTMTPEEKELLTPSVTTDHPKNIKSVLKPMETKESKPNSIKKILSTVVTTIVIIVAGSTTGFGLSRAFNLKSNSAPNKTAAEVSEKGIEVGDIIGSQDESSFIDDAEGVLVSGGVGGEGSHHLLRPGGASQNVYLTSSVQDLDQLVGHKIKVWGETFAAQKAGWLMDVGRAQILELNAEKPFDEELE